MMSDYASTVIIPKVMQRLKREARGEIDFLVLPEDFIRTEHALPIYISSPKVIYGRQ